MATAALCGKCSVDVGDKGMQCDACKEWYHCQCGKIPEALYKVVSKTKCTGIKWFCGDCEEGVGKLLEGMGGMKERQDKLEADMEEIKRELGEIRKDMGKEKISFAEALKKNLSQEQLDKDNGKQEGVSSRAEEREFQMQLNEAMERDKRRKNLVVMGVPEQNEEQTVEFIKDLLAVVMKEDEVEFEFRGRVGKDTKKVRPVRIGIESGEMKRNILKKASTLKGDKKFEKVYICPDLTHKQQEEDKVLRNKAKEFKNNGVVGVKISRGEVIRIHDSGREVLFTAGLPPN